MAELSDAVLVERCRAGNTAAFERVLPIWIGPSEGKLIAWHLRNEAVKRPTSYDFMKSLLELSETQVEQVAINRLHEEIFYATLDVKVRAKAATAEIDCRPSDATNLALRLNPPIFVAQEGLSGQAFIRLFLHLL